MECVDTQVANGVTTTTYVARYEFNNKLQKVLLNKRLGFSVRKWLSENQSHLFSFQKSLLQEEIRKREQYAGVTVRGNYGVDDCHNLFWRAVKRLVIGFKFHSALEEKMKLHNLRFKLRSQ